MAGVIAWRVMWRVVRMFIFMLFNESCSAFCPVSLGCRTLYVI